MTGCCSPCADYCRCCSRGCDACSQWTGLTIGFYLHMLYLIHLMSLLQGRGVLPSLSIMEPAAPGADGTFAMDFKRVAPGETASQKLVVKNNGAVAATAELQLSAEAAECFTALGGTGTFSLDPGEGKTFDMAYHPAAAGKHSHVATLAVARNQFESLKVALKGECHQEELAFLGLPNGESDTLRLPDSALNQAQAIDFALRNSSSKAYRVTWPGHANVSVQPAALHLLPHSTADLRLTFNASAPAALAPADIVATASEIAFADGKVPEVAWSAQAGSSGAATAEPKVTPVKGGDKKLPLKVFALANDSKYECMTREVTFKATPMCQARTFALPIKNTGTTKLPFAATVLLPDGSEDGSGLHTAAPAQGSISPGSEQQLLLRFAPTEVQECKRKLAVRMPNLAAGLQMLEIALDGKVQRPWCHFEVRCPECS